MSSEKAVQIVVEFRCDLFGHFDVQGWNAFVADLMSKDLIPPVWAKGERPRPLAAMIDFSRLRRPRHRLDGIDLQLCWLADADFTGTSLRGAKLGCGRNVCYDGSRLDHADFRDVEISGCSFVDARGLETALFDGAAYDPANPPKGLPPDILARCKPTAEPPPSNPRAPTNPQEPSGFQCGPLRCFASIHLIPIEA